MVVHLSCIYKALAGNYDMTDTSGPHTMRRALAMTKKQNRGWSDNRALALHMSNLGLIPSITKVLPSPQEVTSDLRVKSNL